MIDAADKATAQRIHDAAQRQITQLNSEISRRINRRSEFEKIAEEAQLILDGIRPCDTCKRKVKSPCHNRAGMAENGPWDGLCRDALYPEQDR
jgi:hypothetical protein